MSEATARTTRRSPEILLEEAERAVARALKAGADDAAATVHRRRGLEFCWRDGQLEHVKENATRGLSIALYADGRYSTHATNDLDPDRLERFLDDAVVLTRHLQPDPYRRIPDPELYEGRSDVDLDLVDRAIADLPPDTRLAWCREIHEAAGADDAVISSTTRVHDDYAMLGRATSNGFRGTEVATTILYGATVTVADGEKRPEDAYHVAGTHIEGLPEPADVGREALRRALARTGASKVDSRRAPMVVHPEAGPALIGRPVGALTAGAVQQRRSFLAERKGTKVASPLLTLTDDPLVVRGLGSQHFDAEGIAARELRIVEEGVLRNYFVDTYYGRKLGWEPTTGGPSNLVMRLGERGLEGLLGEVGNGVLVTSWLGGNANLTTGDYSFGVRGHLVEGGAIGRPISEMNVTGNYLELLERLVLVGNDPVPWTTCRTPTLVFEDVQFSGN